MSYFNPVLGGKVTFWVPTAQTKEEEEDACAVQPNGRNDVHVFGSTLPQCRGLLPQKVRPEAGRGAVRGDREESGAAG